MNIIEKTIGFLLDTLGFEYRIDIRESEDENGKLFFCDIVLEEDSNLLIGQHGINLNALQHIARILVKKENVEPVRFVVDVNAYRSEKNNSVVEYVKTLAERSAREGRSITTRPMTAYERRLAHIELEIDDRVETESTGEGENRKVIIRPA
ncbi:protein jag [Patescibacteria group bacterium]